MSNAGEPALSHRNDIATKFGVQPHEALPEAYRPRSTKLSNSLLEELSKLARRVSNLEDFRQRLVRACENRSHGIHPNDRQVLRQDVALALITIDQEEAGEEDKGDRKNDHGAATEAMIVDPKATTSPNKAARAVDRARRVSDVVPSRQIVGRQMANLHSSTIGGSSRPQTGPSAPSVVRKSSRNSHQPLVSLQDEISTRQQEHAFYFNMPKEQHYKRRKPNIIKDVEAITDFDAIMYPVEVPIPGERGSFFEFATAFQLQEYVVSLKKVSSQNATSPAKKDNEESEVPIPAEKDASTMRTSPSKVKLLLDRKMKSFSDSIFYVSASAQRTPGGQTLSGPDRDRVDMMMDTFIRDVRTAQRKYEDGLQEMGLLNSWNAAVDNNGTEGKKEGMFYVGDNGEETRDVLNVRQRTLDSDRDARRAGHDKASASRSTRPSRTRSGYTVSNNDKPLLTPHHSDTAQADSCLGDESSVVDLTTGYVDSDHDEDMA